MASSIYPKTNISKVYYQHMVDQIEHDPLIKHTTFSAACMFAVIFIMSGALLWFAKTNPGNLVQTTGTVTYTNTGKTDAYGPLSTLVSFDFKTKDGKDVSVRQPASEGFEYKEGQTIKIGYHPKNHNFARLLDDTRPPRSALVLWTAPLVIMIGLAFLALFRHHARQVLIWDAAEAANSDD